jgi:hypothetical protein
MKSFIFAVSLCISCIATAQTDKLYLHNGKTIDGSIVRLTEFTVVYKNANEDAERTTSRYSVNKIVYGKNGRTEVISPKINIDAKDDWKNVVILEDNAAAAGLTKVGEVMGNTSFFNYRSAAGSNRKAEEKLKKEACDQRCQFILITSDKDINLPINKNTGLGNTQSIKKGIAYTY